jgi:hypothetical protein
MLMKTNHDLSIRFDIGFPQPLRVSYFIQIPKVTGLKVSRCRALSSPPLPKRLCGKTYVQDLSEASLGSLLLCVPETSSNKYVSSKNSAARAGQLEAGHALLDPPIYRFHVIAVCSKLKLSRPL